MNKLLTLGGINTLTIKYEYPKIAERCNIYECPDCNEILILKKGTERKHHFAHKNTDSKCGYYDNPTESQIHKDAKMLLKRILDDKIPITIQRNCEFNKRCYQITEIDKINSSSLIVLEHRIPNTQYTADVAYLESGEIKYIFEICFTHKTITENRSGLWYEINAIELIKENSLLDVDVDKTKIYLQCVRKYDCIECENSKLRYIQEQEKKDDLRRKHIIERDAEGKKNIERNAIIEAQRNEKMINEENKEHIRREEKRIRREEKRIIEKNEYESIEFIDIEGDITPDEANIISIYFNKKDQNQCKNETKELKFRGKTFKYKSYGLDCKG